jgi:hypothetical protein
MKRKYILIIIFLFFSNISYALEFETDKWFDFEGKLGNMDIQLSFENSVKVYQTMLSS